MTESQFAVIACWLGTIAILVGPAWRALVVFVVSLLVFLVVFVVGELLESRLRR